ncbi:hypothetical protein GQ53DRAFT_817904 [Thozetella sp. PMI_491]|nr:hypothetical protein GQ53DRAFT_817904 [Thozetella sp. PMI_491]
MGLSETQQPLLGKTRRGDRLLLACCNETTTKLHGAAACYAVTVIREDVLPGGTAWATTMFAQLHPDKRTLYVFDQEKDAWFQFNGESWDQIDSPPHPSGVWAGIGSRDLKQNGRDAIRKLMGCLN